MSDEPVFTTAALELIRTMALHGANINRIRGALHSQEGVWFKDMAIITAGRSFGFEIERLNTGAAFTEFVVPLYEQKPRREADKVRLVEPGTHKVPVGGYRLGGARG